MAATSAVLEFGRWDREVLLVLERPQETTMNPVLELALRDRAVLLVRAEPQETATNPVFEARPGKTEQY